MFLPLHCKAILNHWTTKEVPCYTLFLARGTTKVDFCDKQSMLMATFTQASLPPPHLPSCYTISSRWSVQFSCSVVSDSLQPHEPQHIRPSCPSPTPRVHPNPCPLSWWCHPTILSSDVPFSPAFNLSQHQGLFKWVSSSHQVAKVLELQLQHQSFQWTHRTDLL